MGFFQNDLGYYDPLEDLTNKVLELKVTGAQVEIEEDGGWVELPFELLKPEEKK